jgi:arylsulfatase A-like enzyme
MRGRTRPDILLIVIDCGRGFDLPGGIDPVEDLPFLQQLRQECLAFSQALSPSPWTVPGHASLFTGLDPWEHGVHMKSRLELPRSVPTLAERLSEMGYSCLSLSANGFLSTELGLIRGFSDAAWGTWWEKFLRSPARTEPWNCTWEKVTPDPRQTREVTPGVGSPMARVARLGHRLVEGKDPPWMGPAMNLINREIRRRRPVPGPGPLPISPWIEPTFDRWISERSSEEPVFCFVNLLDAHEPYLADPGDFPTLRAWTRHAFQRTDKLAFYARKWQPSDEEFRRLHLLYRRSLRRIDARIAAIVASLRKSQRWKNTLMVLTGDHGQAFGERGYLFHAARLWESVLRVPLWVRWPEGTPAGRTCETAASLVDVAPTVLEAVGSPGGLAGYGRSLRGLPGTTRPRPLVALGDGLQGKAMLEKVSPESFRPWDGSWVAVYQGPRKLLWDVENSQALGFQVDTDPWERRDLLPHANPGWETALGTAKEHAERLGARAPPSLAPEVDKLLRSWGYD